VDCTPANPTKDNRQHPLVIADRVNPILAGNRTLVGQKNESNIDAGTQPIPNDLARLRSGVSVTDAFVDWPTTERMIREAHDKLRHVLPKRRRSKAVTDTVAAG
jgi:3-deoxy-7-phosphoheptulonate synthase